MATPVDGILVPNVQLANSNILSQAVDTFISTNRMPTANEARAQIFQPVVGGILNQLPGFNGAGGSLVGTWESVHYANDLIAHQPKFKFLFKVAFVGFTTRNFYYFVHQMDKPKVKLNHTDVNYYNFRSKVLTSVTFDPLSITFLDEIGNSVLEFFRSYTESLSGQGAGNFGTNYGFGISSSSKSYGSRGYSSGKAIILEQIFANGVKTNRFIFVNPRIESFDFDALDMTDNAGSLMTTTFSYDAIKIETLNYATYYSWGMEDIHRGGGIAGINAGAKSTTENGPLQVGSISGGGGIGSSSDTSVGEKQTDLSYEAFKANDPANAARAMGDATSDLVNPNTAVAPVASTKPPIGSSQSGVNKMIADTINSVNSTINVRSAGRGTAPGVPASPQVTQPTQPPTIFT